MSNANNLLEPSRLRLRGSGGIELAADQFGPVDGPLVVFLHGGGQTRHSWKQTGARLGASGMRVVTVDARGHGDSAWAPDRDYRRQTMVDDLLLVLEQLGAPAVVVGASMGGITGLLATARPGGDAISALVLVDIVTRPEPEGVARVIELPRQASRRLRHPGTGGRRGRRVSAAPPAAEEHRRPAAQPA
ncbi:alpha/beta fold hydrolase [Nocardia asiatica]|uniref:alpha/beta fold hydrolase n=1 Tax=Nocardia asiatica TaxID=209252 RepID=UPI003EE25DBE